MTYKLTNSAQNVIEYAESIAVEYGHKYLGTEHILYGLCKEESGLAYKVLKNQQVNTENVLQKIEELIGENVFKTNSTLGFTPKTKRVIENAYIDAKKMKSDYIGTEHLLLGIMHEGDSIATRILVELGVDITKLFNELVKIMDSDESTNNSNSYNSNKVNLRSYNSTPTLNKFGSDLTKSALDGKLDPIIGRNTEIERVIQILSRRTKNNPCLIGEPGVGKTAIAEGLAQKIILGDVPEILKNKRVVSIDISSMVAGAKYRGDFEERIKKSLEEVKKAGDVILFIDEVHTIVGAGSADGAIDAANILKPLLARGEIQLVGATTINEYRKYIEKDSALERRFSPVIVNEPSSEDTIKILKGIRDKYEAHHNVKITDEAIDSAVKLSVRYVNDRFLPDKAIDLIDEAASRIKIKTYSEPKELKELEEKINKLNKEKEESVKTQKFEKAAKLRDEIKNLKSRLEKDKNKWKNKNTKSVTELTEENIADVISSWTGIQANKITQDENKRLKKLEETLHKRVIGQEEAVSAVSKAIRRGRVGLKNPNRPIGSFLFLGPTGVGKTELSKALAESLFGTEDALIRVDMSEFMEGHSSAKLIGAPPGYVGYDEGGQLTEKIRRRPYSVILFDEIEKAHPDVMNILLQILDDGRLTDSQRRTVDFKNTVIIMTSNVGARVITDKKSLGFSNSEVSHEEEYEKLKKEVMQELKNQFRPEFLNRIDETIVFHKLTDVEINKIIDLMLKEVENRMKSEGMNIKFMPSVKKIISEKGIDKNFGARPLRRSIQSLIEDKIADEILDGNIKKGTEVKIGVKDGKIVIS